MTLLEPTPHHEAPAPVPPGPAGLSRRQRQAAVAAGAAICAFLVPWSGVLASSLPSSPPSSSRRHWALAWAGLDLAEAAAAGGTAWLLAHDDRRAALTAAALATLLGFDAWFDVGTSAPGLALTIAVAEAALLEIPIAVAAGRLALVVSRAPGP